MLFPRRLFPDGSNPPGGDVTGAISQDRGGDTLFSNDKAVYPPSLRNDFSHLFPKRFEGDDDNPLATSRNNNE